MDPTLEGRHGVCEIAFATEDRPRQTAKSGEMMRTHHDNESNKPSSDCPELIYPRLVYLSRLTSAKMEILGYSS